METSSHDLSNPYRKYGPGDLSPRPIPLAYICDFPGIFADFLIYLRVFQFICDFPILFAGFKIYLRLYLFKVI
jgi:hypothetical protein